VCWRAHRCQATDASEAARVVAAGGAIRVDAAGRARVGGALEVTRALGSSRRFAGVVAEPSVTTLALRPAHDCLVVATDGVRQPRCAVEYESSPLSRTYVVVVRARVRRERIAVGGRRDGLFAAREIKRGSYAVYWVAA
jgi:hypothetical protein